MRIANLHHFTEHHRYYIFRGFSLSPLDEHMLSHVYQPMIGASAISLYRLLYHHVAEGRTGYSSLEQQRKLLLGLGLDMNERGRKRLIADASRLEAVGLLQTSRLFVPDNDDFVYEYELIAPLSPDEFFRNQHLALLLTDKVGKYAVIALRESFAAKEPDELAQVKLERENISVPFYELFRLNAHAYDSELEQALAEVAPDRQGAAPPPLATAGIAYGDIIMRFPRNSANRRYVERMRTDADMLAQVNYVAYKYSLDAADLCRLLDEDGMFDANGALLVDELQMKANQLYRQDRMREEERERYLARTQGRGEAEAGSSDQAPEEFPVMAEHYLPVPAQLAGRCDIHQYNMLMRNEPHTRFIQRFFPGAVPEWLDRVFERIDLNYRLPAPVINVLIHYVIGMNDAQRVTRAFIDAVAANMLVKRIDTFEKAVGYVREQIGLEAEKERQQTAAKTGAAGRSRASRSGRNGGTGTRKPAIPIVQDTGDTASISPERLEELRKLARKLDGQS